ncbi:MAG: N-acetyl-gamma-glutamyl-phosphate reductase [Frankiales bacterium]|nr:N-acetyl-gamma-glutamyl-phosphate reductase [Frankiales bacterium]
MTYTVGVAGASGYAGGELLRLLLGHPEFLLGHLGAASSAGKPVTSSHPHLPQLAGRTFEELDADLLAGSDVVFLALPHGESASIVAQLPPGVLVIDLGADFRLQDSAGWETYYGGTHAGSWTYGLPELPGARTEIAGAKRIANPGCYATTVPLALNPLLAAGLVEAADIVVVAASGTSGAGRAAKAHLMGSETMNAMSPYKVGGTHQHTPEMIQSLQRATSDKVTLNFTPLLAPMPRGILATVTARLTEGVTSDDLRDALAKSYDDEPFVHLLPEGAWPHTGATLGSNSVHLQAAADTLAGRAVVVAALDNLTKGAAGQALQNANIALGLPETTGLPVAGVAP